jgi:hypothetical protein
MRDTRRPATSPMKTLAGRDLRRIAIVILVVLVLLDLVVKHYQYFGIDGTFGFAAWLGALSAFVLMLLALALGSLFRAPEGTYDD